MISKVEAFEVIEPGIQSTIQDIGRFGYGQYGVPISGALDSFSYRVANLLVKNSETQACIETAIMGLKLRSLGKFIIAITGGDLTPLKNDEPLVMWRNHFVGKGDIIFFKKVRSGCRSYISVSGGLAVSKIMGSYSTCLPCKFGGLEGRPLKKGDILYRFNHSYSMNDLGKEFPKDWIPTFEREAQLRVILGPQKDHFTEKGIKTFLSSLYKVTPQCDRMGIRLNGPKIERKLEAEESIISEGIIPGAIQVPGDGYPIIILNELVTGGYTKIATVISTDLPKVAQLKPGDCIRFQAISIGEAHKLLEEYEDRINIFKKDISNL